MKKLVVILLILVMCLSIVSCGNNDENVSIANPWVGCKASDIETVIGHNFGEIEGALDTEYRMNESEELVEMTFLLSGVESTVRAEKANEKNEISGIYASVVATSMQNINGIVWDVTKYLDGDNSIISYTYFDEEEKLILNYTVTYLNNGSEVIPPVEQVFNWIY